MLPWRKDRDPYRIWVAEVILQQTRVAQAIPRFNAFVRRFPDVSTLASASREDVLREWAGAGYYGRAHRLHEAAEQLVLEHGAKLPTHASELRALPGFGEYISNAVASIAFGEPTLALESNGLRVGARLAGEHGDVQSSVVRRRLADWLAHQLPPESSGEFNEALMELGEVICRPRQPECPVCPLSKSCRAFQTLADPSILPIHRTRPRRPHVEAAVVILEADGRWLVQRRPPRGLLAGLWEFPGGKLQPGELPETAARRELAEETGHRVSHLSPIGTIHHGYSHFTVDLHAFRGRVHSSPELARTSGRQRWVTPEEFTALPKPKATERVIQLLTSLEPRDHPGLGHPDQPAETARRRGVVSSASDSRGVPRPSRPRRGPT